MHEDSTVVVLCMRSYHLPRLQEPQKVQAHEIETPRRQRRLDSRIAATSVLSKA